MIGCSQHVRIGENIVRLERPELVRYNTAVGKRKLLVVNCLIVLGVVINSRRRHIDVTTLIKSPHAVGLSVLDQNWF